MKKILLTIISCFMLVGCSSNIIKVNQVNNGITNTRIDSIANTIGVAIGVEECESETGYCVKYGFDEEDKVPHIDRTKYDVLIQKKEYFIHTISTKYNEDNKIIIKTEYYYNDYNNDKLVYTDTREITDQITKYSNIHFNYVSNYLYFYFIYDNELIIYEVSSGEFKEIENRLYIDNEYTFDSMKMYKDTYVLVYKYKNKVRYIYNEQVLETNSSDKVVFLEDGYFVSEIETGKAVNSYFVDLENNKIECNVPITISSILVEGKDDFAFVFKGNVWVAQLNENQIDTYDLGVKYNDNILLINIRNENDIILMIQDGSEINVELYEIK